MKYKETKNWSDVITNICAALERQGIRYHVDASSSLFVSGFDFEMDDLDITVEWGCIDKVWQFFETYSPSDVIGDNPKQFKFMLNGHPIDVMSYESDSGVGPAAEREQVLYSGSMIWTKKPSFYLERMRKDHPIRESALAYFGLSS